MTKLVWTADTSRGYPVEVAHIGAFEVTITEGGAGTIGVNIYVGTFAGRVCSISVTREKAEETVIVQARRELLRAGRELAPEAKAG